MTVLLFLITLLVVAYLVGLIRTLRQRVDVLETQLQWALHNFRSEQEKSVPQQTAKTTNIALQPTLWEAEVFPAESASDQPTPIQQGPEPVAAPPVLPAFDTARPQQQPVPPPFRNTLQEKGRADAQAEPSPVPMATDFNWEQFLGAKMLAQANDPEFEAIICFGAILQGQTSHAQNIADSVSKSLADLQIHSGKPIIHGVLLFQNEEQARVRCFGTDHNRGIEAARTAVEMVRVMRSLQNFERELLD